jgi:methionine sulfoxide reductase heme-binding subunit
MSSSSPALWYLSRGTGVVSLVLLSMVVVGGILVRRGVAPARLPRFVVLGLHRNVALLSVAFLAIHIATVVLDSYVPIDLRDAVIPFVSHYRPIWVGLGAVAADLMVALVVTSLLRARIGLRVWRAVHWAAYALWPVAVAHGFGTGSDIGQEWFLAVTAACVGAVLGAVAWRMGSAEPAQPQPRGSAGERTGAR